MAELPASAQQIIDLHQLIEHDEGGWFRETYRSEETINCPDRTGGERPLITTIHYMLEASRPYALLHRNKSDIVHFYEGGGVFRYLTFSPGDKFEEFFLGPGYQRQLIVAGGTWKATELIDGDWGLVGEAVSPGFDYRDRELAQRSQIIDLHPELRNLPLEFWV